MFCKTLQTLAPIWTVIKTSSKLNINSLDLTWICFEHSHQYVVVLYCWVHNHQHRWCYSKFGQAAAARTSPLKLRVMQVSSPTLLHVAGTRHTSTLGAIDETLAIIQLNCTAFKPNADSPRTSRGQVPLCWDGPSSQRQQPNFSYQWLFRPKSRWCSVLGFHGNLFKTENVSWIACVMQIEASTSITVCYMSVTCLIEVNKSSWVWRV